jgi:hypothetical protein
MGSDNSYILEFTDGNGQSFDPPFIIATTRSSDTTATINAIIPDLPVDYGGPMGIRSTSPPLAALLESSEVVGRPNGRFEEVVTCPGFPVRLFASEGESYSWSPPELVDDPTVRNPRLLVEEEARLTVEVGWNEEFCHPYVDTLQVVWLPIVEPVIFLSNDTLFFDHPGAISTEWYYQGEQIEGYSGDFLPVLGLGAYRVLVYGENECPVWSTPFVVTGLESMSTVIPLRLVPNPAQQMVTISGWEKAAHIERVLIRTLDGQSVLQESVVDWATEINVDISGLPNALYIVQLKGPSTVYTALLTKQ